MKYFVFALATLCIFSCNNNDSNRGKEDVILSEAQKIKNAMDSIKTLAHTGDLMVREGDDMLSYQIRMLNETDRTYSHSGIIIEKDNIKYVAHISPDSVHMDSIQYTLIDSFIKPGATIKSALYRYSLSEKEVQKIPLVIDSLRMARCRFDREYDLATNNKLYCSEMISKMVFNISEERIQFKLTTLPLKMRALVQKFFNQRGIPLNSHDVNTRKIMTIDNLYINPACTLVMEAKLKYYPGE